jgi:predicted nucleotidyltransferase
MEAQLKELVDRLKSEAGSNLTTVVLYGSAASGEFHAEHSDLNILCILGQAGARELERLHPITEWWMRRGNPSPLVFTLDEVRRSADIFAIELLDMKEKHRILFGSDFLAELEVPTGLHRLQVERELRTNWLRLRQSILAAPARDKAHLGIMLASNSTFCTLFRHALMALGQAKPASKREAVSAMAALSAGDPAAFYAILDLREGKRKEKEIDVDATLQGYVEFVEVVTDHVDAANQS